MITADDDGDVVLGPQSAESGGSGAVELEAATLVVDPAEPGLLGRVTIFDPALVTPLINALVWSEEVSVAASTLLLPPPREAGSVSPSPALGDLLQLGLLRWLESWSPDDVDPVLLDLEIGCAAAQADWSSDLDLASERLRSRTTELLTRAEQLRSRGSEAVHPTIAGLIRTALRLTHFLLPESDPDFDDIEHAYELALVLERAGQQTLDWEDRSALLEAQRGLAFAGRTPERAVHAGTDPAEVTESGHASVDWPQVPRGLLDRAESTVAWTLDRTSGTVRVRVQAATRPWIIPPPVMGSLAFRAVTADGSIVGVGPLTYLPAEGVYVGTAAVDWQVGTTIDVFDPARIRPPRIGPAAAVAAAERWSARAISLLRLTLGAGDDVNVDPVVALLSYGGRLYEAATGQAPSAWRSPLRAKQVQLLDQLHALAVSRHLVSVERRVAATVGRLGGQARSFAPTATLTATEWALLTSRQPPS